MPGRIGEKFGSYELIQFLGRGGFAEVYLGKHTQLPQQMAAIKILDKQLIIAKSQQFQKEASIVATLRHPNIVQMYDYNVYSNPRLTATLVPYIVMEYAPNKSLRVKHPRGQALPPRTIITYTRQIADALQYAHDQGVMHLDVKPENILINAQNKLLLSDFGLATLLTEEEKTGDIQGTLSYMSPEQLDGKPAFASDQYALAIMVYEWICGRLPFTSSNGSVKEVIDKHLNAQPPSMCAQVSGLPQQAEDVVFKAMAKKVADRYSNIEAFAEALDQALSRIRAKAPVAAPAANANPAPSPLTNANPALFSPPSPNTQLPPPVPAASPAAPPLPVNNVSSPPSVQVTPNPYPNPLSFPGLVSPAMSPNPQISNPPSFPGLANPVVPLPLTPPNNSMQGNQSMSFGGNLAQQPNPALPLTPPILTPGVGGATPAQPNQAQPPFAANNLFSMNSGPSPFQPGPPPGSQSSVIQMPGSPGMPGSPFLNTMPGSPSATTLFGLPGASPFSGQGGPPPYLSGSNPTGQHLVVRSLAQENSLSNFTKTILKRPPATARRRRQPWLVVGMAVNLLGAIFIGRWIAVTTPINDAGWWSFMIATALGLGLAALFFNSGNRIINIVLSGALAVYWGVLGFALGILTKGSFLPDQNILSVLFFGSSLTLLLYLTFKRR